MEESIKRWLFDPTVGKLVMLVIGLGVIRVIVGIIQRSLSRYVDSSELRYRAKKLITFVGYVVSFLFLTAVFSDKLAGFTVAFGVAGAGIAFALQEVIASVAGWIAVSFGNFYNVGDRVQLGGIKGDVIDIGILRTTLMEIGEWVKSDQYNGRLVRVANSFVFKEPVYNYSGEFAFLWDEITVPLKYGGDYKLAKKILLEVVTELTAEDVPHAKQAWESMTRNFRIENAQIEPAVTLVANDNWMEFTLRYVVDHRRRRATKDKLFMRILEEFDKSDKRCEFASATFQLVEVPPIELRLPPNIKLPSA
jgi:small-conductance mechanosensitive channel